MTRRDDLVEQYGEEVVENLDSLVGYCDEAALLVARGREAFSADLVVQRASEAILNRIGDTIRNRLPDSEHIPPLRTYVASTILGDTQ